MALAFLVVFALVGDQCGAVAKLKEASEEVGVEAKVARLGPGALARAHTSDGEGADDQLVAELQ